MTGSTAEQILRELRTQTRLLQTIAGDRKTGRSMAGVRRPRTDRVQRENEAIATAKLMASVLGRPPSLDLLAKKLDCGKRTLEGYGRLSAVLRVMRRQ